MFREDIFKYRNEQLEYVGLLDLDIPTGGCKIKIINTCEFVTFVDCLPDQIIYKIDERGKLEYVDCPPPALDMRCKVQVIDESFFFINQKH
jgi:hypothetical protein